MTLMKKLHSLISFVAKVTEGKTKHRLERYHLVVSTLTLGLKINFDQPIKWIEFQKVAEIKWLPVNL